MRGPSRPFAKVLGLRNSGSNWIEQYLLDQPRVTLIHHRGFLFPRLPDEINRQTENCPETDRAALADQITDRLFQQEGALFFGWKHAAPDIKRFRADPRFADCGFICLLKHPVHFLTSLHRNPYQHLPEPDAGFENFVRRPWQTLQRDNLGGACLETPVALWGRKAAAYLAFQADAENVCVVKYEDLLADFATRMSRCAAKLRLSLSHYRFGKTSAKMDGTSLQEYHQRYLRKSAWQSVSPDTADFIRRQIDPALLKAVGYQ